MKKLVIDCEWKTTLLENGKQDGSPYNPNNYIVSIGFKKFESWEGEDYLFFNHNELRQAKSIIDENYNEFQKILNDTELLIAHNAKSDVSWLKEIGFIYKGEIWDTMFPEYLLARGNKIPLSLEECCKRHKITLKKSNLIEEYKKNKIGFEAIPIDIVEEYGRGDVQSCYELYLKEVQELEKSENKILYPSTKMMNELLLVLMEIERNGNYIDLDILSDITRDYNDERQRLITELQNQVSGAIGDTPINLNSPEHLSQLIYSRKVKDKHKWVEVFNIGLNDRGKPLRRPKLTPQELKRYVLELTEPVKKTKARQCSICLGKGRVEKYKKDGTPSKHGARCTYCLSSGILYTELSSGGFGLGIRSIQDITANGFATDKETLAYLAALPTTKPEAKLFLKNIIRLNAVETYLTSFCEGIRRNVRSNNVLHPSFNQCVTSTGRLSSSDPNFQNQPRGDKLPVKKAIRSRFNDGIIVEVDAAQLEFRVGAELSKCPVMKKEIVDGVDVHAYTAKVLTDAGEPTTRQDAKASTFKPLYGGTSGTPAQVSYVKAFMEKYSGLRDWHESLLDTACRGGYITLPSGRQFYFPNAARNWYGYVLGSTQIKNFPVQSFATADMLPVALIYMFNSFTETNLKSVIINTVHDSIVIDCHPDEYDTVISIIDDVFENWAELIWQRYNYTMTVPQGIEIKAGPSWGELKEVKKVNLL